MNEKAAYTHFRDTTVTNTATSVRADKALLLGWNIINQHSAPITVKFYNIASSGVTVGTSTVAFSVTIPATSGVVVYGNGRGVLFNTAMSIAVTTESADNGTTAPATLPIISLLID